MYDALHQLQRIIAKPILLNPLSCTKTLPDTPWTRLVHVILYIYKTSGSSYVYSEPDPPETCYQVPSRISRVKGTRIIIRDISTITVHISVIISSNTENMSTNNPGPLSYITMAVFGTRLTEVSKSTKDIGVPWRCGLDRRSAAC